MDNLIDKRIEIAAERITAEYEAEKVVAQVFTTETSRKKFINVISELARRGALIKVGGRRLRELVGCKIYDFSNEIIQDSGFLEDDPFHRIRLGPLIEILGKYPEARMNKPDLDFFIWNANPEEVIE